MITIKDGTEIRLPAGTYRFTTDPKKRGIRIARIEARQIIPGDTDAEQEQVLTIGDVKANIDPR